jgi:hypothetical protein
MNPDGGNVRESHNVGSPREDMDGGMKNREVRRANILPVAISMK